MNKMIETGSTLERLAQLVGSLVSIGEVRGSSLALSTTKNLSHTIYIFGLRYTVFDRKGEK